MKLINSLFLLALLTAAVIGQPPSPVPPTKTPTPSTSAVAAPAAPAAASPPAAPVSLAAASPSAAPVASAAAKPAAAPPAKPSQSSQPRQPSQTPKRQQQQPNQSQQPSKLPTVRPPTTERRNILERLSSSAVHSVFVEIVRAANLTDILSKATEITVFAPTDAGFLTTLRDLRYKKSGDAKAVAEFWALLAEKEPATFNITSIVKYHVARGRLSRRDIEGKLVRFADSFIQTKLGEKFEVKEKNFQDIATSMPNPQLTNPLDVPASNGIIHSLNRVLIPTQLNRDAATKIVTELQKTFNPKRKVCFPLSATVRATDGAVVKMSELYAGRHIHVSEAGESSPVFLFSHRTTQGSFEFVRLATQSGHAIKLSAGHYVYANGRLTAAAAVQVGDMLRTVTGPSKVAAVDIVRERGLVAPHTMHGDIVVDGIVASSYTTAVHPRLAQMMLAPVRAVVRLGLATEPLGTVLYNGADHVARFLPRGPERY